MPRKPGNISPEGSGRGSMPLGSSSQGARAGANRAAGAGQRAANLFSRAAKAAEARLKADFKAAGLDWKTGLPKDAAAAARLRAQGAAYRASLRSNRVTALENKLNFPKKAK